MTNKDLNEAQRIADELFKAHMAMKELNQEGLHPDYRETRRLAKMIHLFGAEVEVIPPVHASKSAMQHLLATL